MPLGSTAEFRLRSHSSQKTLLKDRPQWKYWAWAIFVQSGPLSKRQALLWVSCWVCQGFVKATWSEAHLPNPSSSRLFHFCGVRSALWSEDIFFAQSCFLPFYQGKCPRKPLALCEHLSVSLSGCNAFLLGCPMSWPLNCYSFYTQSLDEPTVFLGV